jgi:tetratricopeptide (TPR) repeat protein
MMSRASRTTVIATIAVVVSFAIGAPAPAQALPPEACAAPDALRAAGETERARKDYVALLRKDPALTCAQSGLSALNDPKPSTAGTEAQALCDRGSAYLALHRDADALKAFKAALEKDPKLPCASDGVDEAGPSLAGRTLDNIAAALPQYLLVAGLVVAAFFVLLLLGYSDAYGRLVQLPLAGRILSPRLKLENLTDQSGKEVGDALDARIKERLTRMREEAAGAPEFDLDFATTREDFAVRARRRRRRR